MTERYPENLDITSSRNDAWRGVPRSGSMPGIMESPSREDDIAALGRRLRRLRLAVHGMDNQRLFCEVYGFSYTSWNAYERGHYRPKSEELLRIKQKFRVSTDWILDGTMSLPVDLAEQISKIEADEHSGRPISRRRRRSGPDDEAA